MRDLNELYNMVCSDRYEYTQAVQAVVNFSGLQGEELAKVLPTYTSQSQPGLTTHDVRGHTPYYEGDDNDLDFGSDLEECNSTLSILRKIWLSEESLQPQPEPQPGLTTYDGNDVIMGGGSLTHWNIDLIMPQANQDDYLIVTDNEIDLYTSNSDFEVSS